MFDNCLKPGRVGWLSVIADLDDRRVTLPQVLKKATLGQWNQALLSPEWQSDVTKDVNRPLKALWPGSFRNGRTFSSLQKAERIYSRHFALVICWEHNTHSSGHYILL